MTEGKNNKENCKCDGTFKDILILTLTSYECQYFQLIKIELQLRGYLSTGTKYMR